MTIGHTRGKDNPVYEALNAQYDLHRVSVDYTPPHHPDESNVRVDGTFTFGSPRDADQFQVTITDAAVSLDSGLHPVTTNGYHPTYGNAHGRTPYCVEVGFVADSYQDWEDAMLAVFTNGSDGDEDDGDEGDDSLSATDDGDATVSIDLHTEKADDDDEDPIEGIESDVEEITDELLEELGEEGDGKKAVLADHICPECESDNTTGFSTGDRVCRECNANYEP